MARKTSLREFQLNLNQRLGNLSARRNVLSKLGVQVGDENWLINLADATEIVPPPVFVTVPRTQPWFRGISNVRGKLYSVVDFSAFQGGVPIEAGSERRVILINEKLIEGAALLVSRMLGLRSTEAFTHVAGQDLERPWVRGRLRDPEGTAWLELDIKALARENRFLEVGTSASSTLVA